MTTSERKKMQKTLERIVAEHLDIETLATRKSDSLDFHEVAVWGLKAALEAAYEAALARAKAYRATAIEVRDGSVVTTWTLAGNDLDSARERCSDIFVRVKRIEE